MKKRDIWLFLFLFVNIGLVSAQSSLFQDGALRLYMSFDEDSGGLVSDLSGNGNDGEVYGATLTAGKVGGAYEFDGIDDYISITDKPELSGGVGKKFTWAMWIKPSTIPSESMHIITKSFSNDFKEWEIKYRSDKTISFYYENGKNRDDPCPCVSTTTIEPEEWNHVAVSYDGNIRELKIYINGVFDSSFALEGDLPDTTKDIQIGKRGYYTRAQMFKGLIDEVIIFDRGLGYEEIASLYNVVIPEEVVEDKEEGCIENWQCANWRECADNEQVRACEDVNICGTFVDKPVESRECAIIREEVEEIIEEEIPTESVESEEKCKFTRVDWIDKFGRTITEAYNGQIVFVMVEADGCEGKTVEFTTFETDGIFGKDEREEYKGVILGGKVRIAVLTKWEKDGFGKNAEFVFKAETNPVGDSGILNVFASPGVVCGDGIIDSGEQCDDNNPNSGDGCSSSCLVESGFSCIGEPSVCMPAPTGTGQPTFLFTDILSGPKTGGEDIDGKGPQDAGYQGGAGVYLSVFGRGFGNDMSEVRVLVGGGEVGRYMYIGPAIYASGADGSIPSQLNLDQISVQLGPNVQSGEVVVEIGGVRALTERFHKFTVRPGEIFFMEPGPNGDSFVQGTIGDPANPFSNLQKTFELPEFDAGDFIVMRQGYYGGTNQFRWLEINLVNKGNSENSPLTFYGYPGEIVVFGGPQDQFEGNGKRAIGYVASGNSEGYVFANFKIFKKTEGVMAMGDIDYSQGHVRMVNVDGHSGRTGQVGVIGSQKSHNVSFFGIYLHDNWVNPGEGSKYHHQFYFSGGPDTAEVGWSEFARFDGGVVMSHRNSQDILPVKNIKYHDLIIHDSTTGPITLGNAVGGNFKFYNNIMYRTGKDRRGDRQSDTNAPAGMEFDHDRGPVPNIEYYNNIIYDTSNENKTGGCYSFGHPSYIKLKNNICVISAPSPYNRMMVIRNSFLGYLESDHNLWYHTDGPITLWEASSTPPSYIVGPTDVINQDPMFVKPPVRLGAPGQTSGAIIPNPNPADVDYPDFRLQLGSPAIDVGSSSVLGVVNRDPDLVSRPQDGDGDGIAEVDIGVYEHIGPISCGAVGECDYLDDICNNWYCDTSVGECKIAFTTNSCNDASECTENDRCSNGVCIGTNLPDGVSCTNDGLFCNGNEICQSGNCIGDGDPCINNPINSVCDETLGQCIACQTNADCDDSIDCTLDVCNGVAGCSNIPDDSQCDVLDDQCNTGICDVNGDCIGNPVIDGTSCDINACTTGEICTGGVCGGAPVVLCVSGDGCCPAGCNENNDNECSTDLVGHWKFDEGTGTTASDSSGNGNTGTLINGPLWTTGQVGGALNLDGSDDYVVVNDNALLDITGDMTLAVWVRFDALPTGGASSYPRIIQKGTQETDRAWMISVNNAASPKVDFRIDIGGASNSLVGATTILTNQWYHIVVVRDGSQMKVYVNGVQDGTLTIGTASIDTNNLNLYFGESISNGDGAVDGILDEVRIYNRALTASEILNLYNQDIGGSIATNESKINVDTQIGGSTGVDLLANGTKIVSFSFTVNDGNIVGVNDATAFALFSRAGEPQRTDNCALVRTIGNTKTYQCDVGMQFYDADGIWNVKVNITNSSGQEIVNNTETFVVNTLRDISINPVSFGFGSVSAGDSNIVSLQNTIVTNRGNYEGDVYVTAYALVGETNSAQNIPAGNFRAAGGGVNACSSGNNLVNGVGVGVVSSNLPRGATATEDLSYCLVNVPSGLSSQIYSTQGAGSQRWVIATN